MYEFGSLGWIIAGAKKGCQVLQCICQSTLTSPLSVMTVALIRSVGSDVTSVGGGGTTDVETLQECQILHLERTHESA